MTPFFPSAPPLPLPCSSSVEKDQPILLANGDELSLGDVRFRVALERVAAGEEEQQENADAR